MYAAVLARKYLTTKAIPLLAALAVTLSVATELIVWSVMGGFLTMLVNEGRKTDGDLRITWEHVGFGYYDDLVDRLEADPAIAHATPMIETLAILGMPDDRPVSVRLLGVEAASYADATVYEQSLYWRPIEGGDEPVELDENGDPLLRDPRMEAQNERDLERWLAEGRTLRTPGGEPAMVTGIAATGWNWRIVPGNFYVPRITEQRLPRGGVRIDRSFLPERTVRLTVLPLGQDGAGALDLRTIEFPIANELATGNYAYDSAFALVPLEALQDLLQMGAARRIDPASNPFAVEVGPDGVERPVRPTILGESPARATDVLVRAAEGVTTAELQEAAERVYGEFADARPGEVPSIRSIAIQTYEQRNAMFIGAVQKETTLVLFIFGVVSLTSVFLVLAIFWAMVSEKTRDIGVLRAIGASGTGVAAVWVGYGLAIGIVGSALGAGLAALVVTNINPIHEWLGRALGVQVWDPNVYYFTTIPTDLDGFKFVVIVTGGIVASVVGALVPAARAAWMDPVKALRFD
ncbi:MAG: FtsX-like permease family protein [Phycisphaerales bacterium]|jgi:lipoprotein-releasing system permease protein